MTVRNAGLTGHVDLAVIAGCPGAQMGAGVGAGCQRPLAPARLSPYPTGTSSRQIIPGTARHTPASQRALRGTEANMKRTYQASKVRRARTHGFLVRMKSRGGRAVINARRAKGRKRLAV